MVDHAEHRGDRRFERGILDALERELDIIRIEIAAIMEFDARLQFERPFRGIGIGRPALRQLGHRRAIIVLAHQAAIDDVVHFIEAIGRDRIDAFLAAITQIIGAQQHLLGMGEGRTRTWST